MRSRREAIQKKQTQMIFFLNRKAIKNSPFEGRKNLSKLPQNA
jgi:hypothetical protein